MPCPDPSTRSDVGSTTCSWSAHLRGTPDGLLLLAGIGLVGPPDAGAEADIRVLGDGEVVVVDRFGSTRRLLADLRRWGVDQPRLVVFRGPLPDGLADALEQRLGPHER